MGNKLYQEDLRVAADSELYAYDDLYRLTSWERGELNAEKDGIPVPHSDQTWNLDPVGNWDETSHDGVTELRQHNAVNELVHRDNALTTALVYCDSGNLIEDHEHEYVYDAFNRLVQVVRKSDSQTIATYRYDTQNRRVKRIVENSDNLDGTTQYVYDGWQVVEERNGQDAVTATYTYGNYIDEPITLTAGNNTYYYHTNNLYNVRALTDGTGTVVERYRYSAYGLVTILDAGDQEIPESTVGNVYMFQGRRYDPETGLYYYRNRMMSSELGRFLQRDPLGYVDGWNLYQYVWNNPIIRVDPSGELSLEFRADWLNLFELDVHFRNVQTGETSLYPVRPAPGRNYEPQCGKASVEATLFPIMPPVVSENMSTFRCSGSTSCCDRLKRDFGNLRSVKTWKSKRECLSESDKCIQFLAHYPIHYHRAHDESFTYSKSSTWSWLPWAGCRADVQIQFGFVARVLLGVCCGDDPDPRLGRVLGDIEFD